MWPINGYMYGLKTSTKQSKSHFINMDIKIESMALVTVVDICQLVYAGCQRVCFCSKAITDSLQKKRNPLALRVQLMWPIHRNLYWSDLFELTSFPFK